jgi:hypothetical protein
MKKSITLLLGLLLSFSSLSQYSQNLDGMSNKEIKQFLLEQDDDQVKMHLKKYSTGQTIGGLLMLTGVSIVVASEIGLFKNSESDIEIIEEAFQKLGGGLLLITGGIISGTSSGQLKKAMGAYINPAAAKTEKPKKYKYGKDYFIFNESLSPETKEMSLKYLDAKKASQVSWMIAGASLLTSFIANDTYRGSEVSRFALKFTVVSSGFGLLTSIVGRSYLNRATDLHEKQSNVRSSNRNFKIRDASKIYDSINH